MLFIIEVALIICLLVAVIIVVKNNNSTTDDREVETSNSFDSAPGKNDLTEDKTIEYDTIVYRTSAFMVAESDETIKLSESGKQRLDFVIYAYSMNVQHDYEDNIWSFAYISLADLKSDYEALYGGNYNFDEDYESAAALITKKCPPQITAKNTICINSDDYYPYSYSFNSPTITGQDNSYKMTGTYQKIDNDDVENAVDLNYFFEFKDSHLLEFVAPAEL